jgi:hypothetical protein
MADALVSNEFLKGRGATVGSITPPPSLSEQLRTNKKTVEEAASQVGTQLTPAHAIRTIESTKAAAELGGEPFSAVLSDVGAGAETTNLPMPTETPVVPTVTPAQAPKESGLEPTEEAMVELGLSIKSADKKPTVLSSTKTNDERTSDSRIRDLGKSTREDIASEPPQLNWRQKFTKAIRGLGKEKPAAQVKIK